MPLTDAAIRKAKSAAKPVRLYDSGGLYLEVAPAGGKWWRLKYRFGGKEKRLSLGVYPDVGLKEARERRDGARKLLAEGVDPGEHRKEQKAAKADRASNSFEAIAREWFGKFSPNWAQSHADKIISRFERDVFPWIGARPIAEINAPELLRAMRRIEERGALETAHRALQNCGQVFRYAVAHGLAERDPSGDLRGALPPVKGRHFAAITDPQGVAKLLRSFDEFKGSYIVLAALRLSPLFFVRPGELRQAKWSDIDFDKAEWRYVVTKTDSQHLVPLAEQSVKILRDLYQITGGSPYIFAGRDPKRPMSENTVNAALRRLGYNTQKDMTGHGFRAMARTILHEELHFDPDVIEHQLAHQVPDALGTAYNRTKFLSQRRKMMQIWADYLDSLKSTAAPIAVATSNK
ncbi:MAG: integrase arm-type DNA-binding domain-containing protein [Proteobacteria bacterium]|nr:integrase arm-type DNA-binding domain-containing protein [Pseudomonadota bacterium]HQR02849.1 integrase arm-type DNA-binding domain-containing protein [Rhodocyclaceae bacterium]